MRDTIMASSKVSQSECSSYPREHPAYLLFPSISASVSDFNALLLSFICGCVRYICSARGETCGRSTRRRSPVSHAILTQVFTGGCESHSPVRYRNASVSLISVSARTEPGSDLSIYSRIYGISYSSEQPTLCSETHWLLAIFAVPPTLACGYILRH